MIKYIIKRLLQLIPILVGITFLSFAMMRLAGGDAVTYMYENAGSAVSQEVIDETRKEYGLDQPFLVQYAKWFAGMATGDMGKSYVSRRDVYETFIEKLPATIVAGATDSSKIGQEIDSIDMRNYRCVEKQNGAYIVAVMVEDSYYLQGSLFAILIVGIYLTLASCCMVYMLSKVMKEKYEKEKFRYTSNTDELTRCYNRRAYEEDINKLDLTKEWVYVSMDINGLKNANDSFGHAAGDELIRAAADCMKNTVSVNMVRYTEWAVTSSLSSLQKIYRSLKTF